MTKLPEAGAALLTVVAIITATAIVGARDRGQALPTWPIKQATTEPTILPSAAKAPLAAAEARQRLTLLPTTVRTRSADYRRNQFGPSWVDVDNNGCNQRDDVLMRDADLTQPLKVARQGRCQHDVIAGTWQDPYTGRTMSFTNLKDSRQAQAIQIDHVVPLAVAWRDGASDWPRQDRINFANDVANLVAVDGPTNASKGASDAAAWRPRRAHQCQYAIAYIKTKYRWGLSTNPPERDALSAMLQRCRS